MLFRSEAAVFAGALIPIGPTSAPAGSCWAARVCDNPAKAPAWTNCRRLTLLFFDDLIVLFFNSRSSWPQLPLNDSQ